MNWRQLQVTHGRTIDRRGVNIHLMDGDDGGKVMKHEDIPIESAEIYHLGDLSRWCNRSKHPIPSASRASALATSTS